MSSSSSSRACYVILMSQSKSPLSRGRRSSGTPRVASVARVPMFDGHLAGARHQTHIGPINHWACVANWLPIFIPIFAMQFGAPRASDDSGTGANQQTGGDIASRRGAIRDARSPASLSRDESFAFNLARRL